jgi:fatty-acyl-CoA synthase
VAQLDHAALLTQARIISDSLALESGSDSGLSWLPFFHDMGLIGFVLTPMYAAASVTFLRTEDFMLRPGLWMKAASQFRATVTGGPPSAYDLCARSTKDHEVTVYELGCLRAALVGAEMIFPESLRRFAQKFEPAGLRWSALMPTYGLAENGLAVTMTPLGRGPEFDQVDLGAIQNCEIAQPSSETDPTVARVCTSVGLPLENTKVCIADERGRNLGERHVGEVLVHSHSLMRGYLGDVFGSQQALSQGWLYTGDLGYIANGKLYITGRKKEILIVGGRNYIPDDLERVVQEVPGVRWGRVVAFSRFDSELATELVCILVETARTKAGERDNLRLQVRHALIRAGYPVGEVVLVRPGTIHRTPSGKVMRMECKRRYFTGEFSGGEGRLEPKHPSSVTGSEI